MHSTNNITIPCEQVGFTPPGIDLHVKLIRSNDSYWLTTLADGDKQLTINKWLSAYKPERVIIDEGISPKKQVFIFKAIPEKWKLLIDELDLAYIHFNNDKCTIHTNNELNEIKDFIYKLNDEVLVSNECKLTSKQVFAIHTASKMGYYMVPKKTSLHEIAKVMNTTPAAVSELLRRGEQNIIETHINNYVNNKWIQYA